MNTHLDEKFQSNPIMDFAVETFTNWWNSNSDRSSNPFRPDSPCYWAWEGWKAALNHCDCEDKDA